MKAGPPARRSRAAGWSRLIGGLALPVLVLAALGVRIGIVPESALIPVIALGFSLGLVALGLAAYALVDIWNSGADGAKSAIAAIVYAAPVLILVAAVAAAVIFYPPITEVSTDVFDPPVMLGVAGASGDRSEAERIALQAEAYPDLAPRVYAQPIAQVYMAARALVEDRGWRLAREIPPPSLPAAEPAAEVVAAAAEDEILARKAIATQSRGDAPVEAPPAVMMGPPAPEAATLQAVALTTLFGFADDVVLRLVAENGGTRVDMRSASRKGEHDLGQNARRVRAFFADLDLALQPDPDASEAPVPVAPVAEPAEPASR